MYEYVYVRMGVRANMRVYVVVSYEYVCASISDILNIH